MYIPVLSHNGFIFILIFGIPNEPLGIIISDTWEILHTRCLISIIKPAHTNFQLRCSYTVLLTQAIK
ncbi:hypothetical protein F383_04505 [Gossypium arboreum]|uniref:Uncharacterized protein n=1 Tax=Gossypium arboreum TaxID=29729 RepID=A0A0B0PHX8_GOSAR|nr:hypothetical protein F383_04505 [Gossypium arboreum]